MPDQVQQVVKDRFDYYKAKGLTAVQARAKVLEELLAYRRYKRHSYTVSRYVATLS
jgi:hypothetical protein